jgi:hypothetical protein
MAKISSYTKDTDLTGTELLLSSNSDLSTVNIQLSALRDYVYKNTYSVANATARLALTVSPGAMCFQADTENLYIKKTSGWVLVI